jgi:cell division protein FtsB
MAIEEYAVERAKDGPMPRRGDEQIERLLKQIAELRAQNNEMRREIEELRRGIGLAIEQSAAGDPLSEASRRW